VTPTPTPTVDPLYNSLVAYWRLNETSGTRADATGRGNTLTDNNTVTSNPGIISTAAQFTHANAEYFSIADNADVGNTGSDDPFTIQFWVYPGDVTANYNVASKASPDPPAANSSYEYQCFQTSSSRFLFAIGNGSTGASVTSTVALSNSTWYHVIIWHDPVANTANIWVNGTVTSTAWAGGTLNGSNPMRIGTVLNGSSQVGQYAWDGRIGEGAIWKRVLTAGERTRLYNSGAGLAYPW